MKTKWRVEQWSPQNTWLQVAFLCTDGFNLEILPCGFGMQHQIMINVIILVAYMLNLPLNMQKPHYYSQCARKWSLISAYDSCLIYCAPTYIAVPLLGPHQLQYIESILGEVENGDACSWSSTDRWCSNYMTEWSKILLPSKVWHMLQVWRQVNSSCCHKTGICGAEFYGTNPIKKLLSTSSIQCSALGIS